MLHGYGVFSNKSNFAYCELTDTKNLSEYIEKVSINYIIEKYENIFNVIINKENVFMESNIILEKDNIKDLAKILVEAIFLFKSEIDLSCKGKNILFAEILKKTLAFPKKIDETEFKVFANILLENNKIKDNEDIFKVILDKVLFVAKTKFSSQSYGLELQKKHSKLDIKSLIVDVEQLSASNLLKRLNSYKNISSEDVSKISPLSSLIKRHFGNFKFNEIKFCTAAAKKVIDTLIKMGDSFNNEKCLYLLQAKYFQERFELIELYNPDFDYYVFFDEVYSFTLNGIVDKEAGLFLLNKYSIDFLERDQSLTGEKITPMVKLFFERRAFAAEGLILEIREKEMDFSADINELILFQIIKETRSFDVDIFKYFLDKPGINLDAVDKNGNSFEKTFELQAESSWINEVNLVKMNEYFEHKKINFEVKSEFNL